MFPLNTLNRKGKSWLLSVKPITSIVLFCISSYILNVFSNAKKNSLGQPNLRLVRLLRDIYTTKLYIIPHISPNF